MKVFLFLNWRTCYIARAFRGLFSADKHTIVSDRQHPSGRIRRGQLGNQSCKRFAFGVYPASSTTRKVTPQTEGLPGDIDRVSLGDLIDCLFHLISQITEPIYAMVF